MSYFDAQGYEIGEMYSWRDNQFPRLIRSYNDKFDSRIVYELIKSENSCRIESANYSILIWHLSKWSTDEL